MIVRFCISLSFIMLPVLIWGQSLNSRCKWVKEFDTPVVLDSLTIVPESLSVSGDPSIQVDHDINNGLITVDAPAGLDSVLVCYRVLPLALHTTVSNRTLAEYDSTALFKDKRPEIVLRSSREELFESGDLFKSGSLSRGISFGNNQDVFVNSTLNLMLDGKLTDDLNIRASITDQNIPFQPEGNTRNLQEFDNVFIQLYNDNISVTGGDIVLRNQPSYFLRHYKNVQGGLGEFTYRVGDGKATTRIGASVAKGKFASVVIESREGVLGPYKIPGPDNEQFVIVIANSEKVFIDGKRLVRGFNEDYVIDYNLGEITFTNRVLITRFTRIRVDYEFADRNYSRSITTLSHHQSAGNANFYFNAYSESDNKNRPLLFDLNQDLRQALAEAGDDPTKAVGLTADSVAFDPQRVLYRKLDTVDNDGNQAQIFEYSTNPEEAHFQVAYAFKGQGNGNYIRDFNAANGQVYVWVSPEGGVPQGDYEPESNIPTPDNRQMVTFGGDLTFAEHHKVFGEFAITNRDLNLFSPLDDDDNQGWAGRVGYGIEKLPLGASGYNLSTSVDYEYDDKHFSPIDRFRYIEFDRDWSYNPVQDTTRNDDRILRVSASVEKDSSRLNYRLVTRDRGDAVDGYQHYVTFEQYVGRFRIYNDSYYLSNNQRDIRSEWLRTSTDLSLNLSGFVPGYRFSVDKNEIVAGDSITGTAMNFEEHSIYLRSADSTSLHYIVSQDFRNDYLPSEGKMVRNNRSQTTTIGVGTRADASQRLNFTFIYRKLENLRLDTLGDEETVSSRLDWVSRWWDNNIHSHLTYSIGNGRELRREFIYILVPAGEGTHTWRDLNGDGVQDLNEFFEAVNPDERNYIKLLLPSNEFITTFDNNFNYRFRLKFPRSWRNQGPVKSFLSRISNNTSWSSAYKITDDDITARLIPFLTKIDEELILSTRETMRSTVFFNRSDPRFGLSASWWRNRFKQLLVNGFDLRESVNYEFKGRLKISRHYSLNGEYVTGNKKTASDFLQSRNYEVRSRTWSPGISWQPTRNFRAGLNYKHSNRVNDLEQEDPEQAIFNEILAELKYNSLGKTSINAQFRYSDIEFTGEENTALGYELLQALKPGQNYLWSAGIVQKMINGLRLSVFYDGRKSPENKVIHTGRMQVTALF